MADFLRTLWAAEPARIIGVVTAVIDLAIAFGAPLTIEQKASLIGIVTAVLALIQAEVTRSRVTPV